MPTLIVRDTRNGRVKEIELTKRKFSIGKNDYNDLVLPREGVSREHCMIVAREDGFYLVDSSRNGTILDGAKLHRAESPLPDGARFEVSDVEIQFRVARQRSGRSVEAPGADVEVPSMSTSMTRSMEDRTQKAKAKAMAAAPGSAEHNTAIRLEVHERLLGNRELKRLDFENMPEAEARRAAEKVAVQIIKQLQDEGRLDGLDRRSLLKQVLDEALGLGPLEVLLADDDISEIMVNAHDKIFVERRGVGMVKSEIEFTSNEQVIHVIRRICAPIGRRINEQTPLVDGRLADGSRVNAVIPPLAVSGPSLTIRKFPKDRLGVQDLVGFKSLTENMGKFMEIAVREHLNICISGGTGSGKTTLLNIVSSFIGKTERIVTVEDVSELQLPQEHVVTLETRPPNLEGEGAITIRDLVKNCLRMRPDRIVVGECRGGEALDMLQAMNTGHDGSLTTIHSNSPRDCIARLETLVLMAGMDLPSRAIREQIASAVHMIIQQSRLVDGSRKVIAISEVTGMEGDVVTLQDIFVFRQTGFTPEGKVIGQHEATGNIPKFIHALRKRGIDVDMSIFQNPGQGGGLMEDDVLKQPSRLKRRRR